MTISIFRNENSGDTFCEINGTSAGAMDVIKAACIETVDAHIAASAANILKLATAKAQNNFTNIQQFEKELVESRSKQRVNHLQMNVFPAARLDVVLQALEKAGIPYDLIDGRRHG